MRRSLIYLHIDKATVVAQPKYKLSSILIGVSVGLFLIALFYSILI